MINIVLMLSILQCVILALTIPYIDNVVGQVTYFMEDNFLQTIHKKIAVLMPSNGLGHIVCSNVTTNSNNMMVNWKILRTGNNTAEFINELSPSLSAYYEAYTPNDLAIVRINLDGQVPWFGPTHCEEFCLRYLFWENDMNIVNAINDSSNGMMQLSYDKSIITTVSINFDGLCRLFEWIDVVTSLLDLQSYKYKLLVVPLNAHCVWEGLATLSCSYNGGCYALVRSENPGVYIHELGHNFGFTHSSSDTDDNGMVNYEYGDNTCYMGNVTGWKRYNALHRWTNGWIPKQNKYKTFWPNNTIDSYVLSSSSINFYEPVIQILTIVNPSTGIEYWLSLRTRVDMPSYDSQLDSRYVNKISIHRYNSLYTSNKLFIQTLEVGNAIMNNKVVFYGFINDHQVRIDIIGNNE
jgi:hypothetical protein